MSALEASVRLVFDDGRRARPLQAISAELEDRRRDLEDGIAAAAAELATINRMLGHASAPVTLPPGMKLAPLAPVPPDGGPPPAPASEQEQPSTRERTFLRQACELDPLRFCDCDGDTANCNHAGEGAAQDAPPPEDEASPEAPGDASDPAPADASPAATDDAFLREEVRLRNADTDHPSQSTGAARPLDANDILEAVRSLVGWPNATPSGILAELGRSSRNDRARKHVQTLLEELQAAGLVERGGTYKRGIVWRPVAAAAAPRRGDPDDASPEDPEPEPITDRGDGSDWSPEPEASPSAAAPDDASPPSTNATPASEGYDRPFEERCWCTEKEHPRCPRHHPERSRPAVVPRDGYQQPTTAGDVLAFLSLAGNPLPLASIAEALSQPRSAVEVALRKLVEDGDVVLDKTTRRYEVNRYA